MDGYGMLGEGYFEFGMLTPPCKFSFTISWQSLRVILMYMFYLPFC